MDRDERSAPESAPETPREALRRARGHARAAARETVFAARALLDAASLAASGAPADAHRGLEALARTLDAWAGALARGAPGPPGSLVEALADALDAEIVRWETRAADGDADARAVLRAFLGLREILWELGVRRSRERGAAPGAGTQPGEGDTHVRRRRVERVKVQG